MEATNPSNVVIHGYLAMFVFFTAALSAERIVRERQNHTLERLLASSVKRESILGGIFANTAAKGLIQILVFWTLGILVFENRSRAVSGRCYYPFHPSDYYVLGLRRYAGYPC